MTENVTGITGTYLTRMHPEDWKYGEQVRQVVYTPAHARKILDEWSYAGQRKIRESRIKANHGMMERGEWKHRSEIHIGVLPDGTHRMLNGYHRMHALARCEENVALPFRLILTPCKDEEEMAEMYGVIDWLGARGYNDAIHAAGLADEWGVLFEPLKAASSASALIMTEFTGGRSNSTLSAKGRTVPGRIAFLREWREPIMLADGIIRQASKHTRYMLLRQAVMAVMLMTFKHVPEKAEPFWRSIATAEGLTAGSPTMALYNWLHNTPVAAGHEHIYSRRVAAAWNAYMEGRSLTKIEVRTEGLVDPIVIEGTPYTRANRENAARHRRTETQIREQKRTRVQRSHVRPVLGETLTIEGPVPEVQIESRLLSTVPALLRENYGPQPGSDPVLQAVPASTSMGAGEQGGTRPS